MTFVRACSKLGSVSINLNTRFRVNAIAIHVLANVCLIAQSTRDFLRHLIRAKSSASCSVERSTIKKDSNCFFLVLNPIAYAPKPKQGEARIVRNKNVNTRGIGHAGSHRLVAISEVLNIRDPIARTSFKSPVLSVCIWLKPARSTPLVSVGVGGNVMHVGSPVLGCSIRRADSMAPCHKACRSFESSSSLAAHAVSRPQPAGASRTRTTIANEARGYFCTLAACFATAFGALGS
jgi:hypothetical protein